MKYITAIIFVFFTLNLFAQQKQFSLDERRKYIYYEVADGRALNKDTLLNRAQVFINKFYKKTIRQVQLSDTSIIAKGKVIIDKTVLIAGHPSGEVSYSITFQARNGKYRFWLTDFEYIPYQRDRYGNYVASTKNSTPLEKTPSKLMANEWKDMVVATYDQVQKFGNELKAFINTNPSIHSVKDTKLLYIEKW